MTSNSYFLSKNWWSIRIATQKKWNWLHFYGPWLLMALKFKADIKYPAARYVCVFLCMWFYSCIMFHVYSSFGSPVCFINIMLHDPSSLYNHLKILISSIMRHFKRNLDTLSIFYTSCFMTPLLYTNSWKLWFQVSWEILSKILTPVYFVNNMLHDPSSRYNLLKIVI